MQVPEKQHYPKKTWMMIKKTSLLLDELELRREEEKKFLPTTQEQFLYSQLAEIFPSQRPAKEIETALEDEKKRKVLRSEFLDAAKEQQKAQTTVKQTAKDDISMVLFATGTPVLVIGMMLLDTFFAAGLGVLATGFCMYLPAVFTSMTTKRKQKKKLKETKERTETVAEEMEETASRVDQVCKKYGLPLNYQEREQCLSQLLSAATEYERIGQKRTDYELLKQLNGSDRISREIANNLSLLSGKELDNESKYKETISYLEDQLGLTTR